MTEIMPFPENNYETVLLDRPEWAVFAFIADFCIPEPAARDKREKTE